MTRPRLAAPALVVLGLTAVGLQSLRPAAAADSPPTPDQAAVLEGQVRGWLANLLGPTAKLPERPVKITAVGDHYAITVPTGSGAPLVTGVARPRDDGTWAIDDILVSSPQSFQLDLGAIAAQASDRPVPPAVVNFALKMARQDVHAALDPTGTTPSSLHGTWGAVRLEMVGPMSRQIQHFDSYSFGVDSRPVSSGRTDLQETTDIVGFTSVQHANDGGNSADTKIAAKHLHMDGHIDSLDHTKIAAIVSAGARLGDLISAVLRAGALNDRSHLADINPGAARDLVLALTGLAQGMAMAETADGLTIDGPNVAAVIDHARLGIAGTAPDDKLDMHLDLALDGLALPSLPDEQGALVPRRIALRPTLSGISMHDLTQLAIAATDPATDPTDLLLQTGVLFARGGVRVGLDDVAIDIGPANIVGRLDITLTGLTRATGQGKITVNHFDALVAKLAAIPEAAESIPVLAMLRKLGRQDGDAIVWDLSLQGSHLLVNGTDVWGLGPGTGTDPGDQSSPPDKKL